MAQSREAHDHVSDQSKSKDCIEAGLRALFEDHPPATANEPHKSVACILGETLGMVSQISLHDAQDASSPVIKPHAGAKADVPPHVGRYHLLGELARGGVGAVYKARDEDLGRDVALKVLLNRHAGNSHMTQRFVEEAQIGGQLQHPGIVPVHELGVYAGKRPYIAMKLVKGQTLARLLENRKDPTQERQRFLGIFEQICQPVAYAHARGVIHRDLKPSNVMVGAFGEVQVMDWGLAKVVRRGGARDDDKATKTANTVSIIETARTGSSAADSVAGSVVGTPSYMPPEQARGLVEDIDERSDVFGLGAILLEILTGHPPYTGRNAEELHRQARKAYLDDALARLTACDADAEVIDLARRCLAAEPKDRPRDAGAVAASIASYLESLAERARASQIEAARAQIKAREEQKARRLTAALAAAVLVAVIAGASGYLWVERQRRDVALQAAIHFQSQLARAETLAEQAANMGPAGRDLWAAAAEAAKTANGLVTDAVDEVDRERLAQLGQLVARQTRNHRLIARLEFIRDQVTYAGIDHAYATAFRELLGADITDVSPENVNKRILETGIASELALALDDWALVRRRIGRPWQEIADAAMVAAPTRWRVAMWSAVEKGDPKELEDFVETLRETATPAAFLCTLADSLRQEGNLAAAERLLRQAVRNEPSSYRANSFLGRLLADPRVGNHDESLRYLFAALAIRQDDRFFRDVLANGLSEVGEFDQAMQVYISVLRSQNTTWGIDKILELLERDDATLADLTLDDLRRAIKERLAVEGADPRQWEILGATLARRFGEEEPERALEVAQQEVERTRRQNRHVLNMLARVQYASGQRHDAIRTLEEAVAQHDLPLGWLQRLREYRQSVLPKLVSYASIDDVLAGEEVITEGDTWSYFVGSEAPSDGLEWTTTDFDDSRWQTGPSGFGYLPGRTNTFVDMSGRYSTMYVRRRFGISDAKGQAKVLLSVLADDGFVAYVNGRRVGYARMDPDANRHDALGVEGGRTQADEIDVTPFLQPGVNILAIQGANNALFDDSFLLLPTLAVKYSWDPADQSGRIHALRTALSGSDQDALWGYLDGRRLQLSGKHADAAAKFREVLAIDRSRAEPFLRLVECLRETDGPERAARLLADELQKGLPGVVLYLAPQKPRGLEARFHSEEVRLTASPFEHLDPRVEHASTRWEIRQENGEYRRNPVVDIVSSDDLTSLSLPYHRLRPNTIYVWRATYVSGTGQAVVGDESTFATPDYGQETVSFDLTPWFNRDVVVNPGDTVNETVDGSHAAFVENGYDGSSFENPHVYGLPVDGMVGIHRLGDYDRNNVIQIAMGETKSFRISVPDRRYEAIRFLMTAGWGDAEIPIRFEYADGSTHEQLLRSDDWLDEPGEANWEGIFLGTSVPILNNLYQLYIDHVSASHAALFEASFECNPRKKLKAVVLDPRRMTGSLERGAERTHFNLFAATGVCGDVDPR